MKRIALLLATIAIAACADRNPDFSAGAEQLKPFKLQLKEALQAGMAEGPTHAIDVCARKAPEIAASLSVDGVQMGRTSHKLRNPDNVAPQWANEVLARYRGDPAQWEPVDVELGNGRLGRVEPIVTQPLCTVCHGDAIAPEIAGEIGAAYPDDEATGFQVGELRGVFWIEYPERH